MGFVKRHLGLILPLFAILFSIEYLVLFDRVVQIYQERLAAQYRVILVADKGLKPVTIRNANVLIKSVEPIDAKKVLKRIRKQVDAKSLKQLEAAIPAFYSIRLRDYPSKARLKKLQADLEALPGVRRVQIFKKSHDRLYGMLLFMKSNLYAFGALLGLVSLLLLVKQMQIWQLEHRERMQIMALFGAPVWLRSGVLYRLAIVDTFWALLLVFGAIFYLASDATVLSILDEMAIPLSSLLRLEDFGTLAGVGFALALATATWVVMRFREEL